MVFGSHFSHCEVREFRELDGGHEASGSVVAHLAGELGRVLMLLCLAYLELVASSKPFEPLDPAENVVANFSDLYKLLLPLEADFDVVDELVARQLAIADSARHFFSRKKLQFARVYLIAFIG